MGAGNFVANSCRVVPTRIDTTDFTTVLLATGYTQVIGIRLANFGGADVQASVTYFNAPEDTSFYLLANHPIGVGQAVWLPLEAFALNENDLIQVQSSVASSIDAIVSIAEVPGRSG